MTSGDLQGPTASGLDTVPCVDGPPACISVVIVRLSLAARAAAAPYEVRPANVAATRSQVGLAGLAGLAGQDCRRKCIICGENRKSPI